MKKTILFLAFLLTYSSIEGRMLKNPKKAKQIAYKMINRNDGKSRYTKTVLLSCAFKKKGGKRKCSSKPRKKVMEGIAKDIGKGGKDSINLSLISFPPSEKGVAFLQKDYDNTAKDSDQWMYLPALKRLKRIVSQSLNSPKTGSLFGSEIAYEDMEKIKLSDYEYSYLGEGKVDGKKVNILESFPTAKRAKKTSYGKGKIWVDMVSYIVLKSESYNRRGKLVKTFYSKKLKKIGGIWVARLFIVVNHKNQRMTMMKTDKIALNINVASGLFEVRALKDASFRESKMRAIRKAAK